MNARRLSGTIAAAAMMLAFTARTTLACEEHAQAEAKDAKAAVAGEAKAGCTMPCCAKKAAAEAKNAAPGAMPAAAVAGTEVKADAPCAAAQSGKGCPKKAAAVAKTDAAPPEPVKAEAPTGAGSNR